MCGLRPEVLDLILRSGVFAASRRMNGTSRATWFETREDALLTMRVDRVAPAHTFSNGTSISVRFSSHAGTGRFFERMNAGLNSFD